jgi:hypothetical protein
MASQRLAHPCDRPSGRSGLFVQRSQRTAGEEGCGMGARLPGASRFGRAWLGTQSCGGAGGQPWKYMLSGHLIDWGMCLSAVGPATDVQSLAVQNRGHNLPNQIWSLPN